MGFRGVAVVLRAVFWCLRALVAAALGGKLGAGLQGVITSALVMARRADAASWVLEVGVGSPGCDALLVDRGVGLAWQMAPPAI